MTSLFLSLPYLLNATLIQTDYEDNIHQCKINWGRLRQVFILELISLQFAMLTATWWLVLPFSEYHLKSYLSREECLDAVVKELNAMGNETQEMGRIQETQEMGLEIKVFDSKKVIWTVPFQYWPITMSDWKYSTSREILYAYCNCSYVHQSSCGLGVRLLRPG